ncbi:MAG: aminopeptidase [bacterium]|nr:aminopeptidase [bacterium]
MIPTDKDFQLARVFLNHSLKLKPKQKLLITTSDSGAFNLVKAVYIEALKQGVYPLIDTQIDFQINRSHMNGFAYQFYQLANDWQLKYIPKQVLEAKIDWADAFIRIATLDNSRELSQIPTEKISLRQQKLRPIFDKMIDKGRWVLTYYPTPAMAQDAGVAFDWLVDFYYQACLTDYARMEKKLKRLEKLLDQGNKIQIRGENTNLTFSIKGRLAQAAYGEANIPDGEVFLAPLEKTVEGRIYFDMPTMYMGNQIEGIYLEFKAGQVIKAKAKTGQKELEKILDTDQGAKYVGEFAIGANYNIKQAMKNTLFDEKIGGTIHLALGRAYSQKRGGGANKSAIHWDIVKDMRFPNHQVLVDNQVILNNGQILA